MQGKIKKIPMRKALGFGRLRLDYYVRVLWSNVYQGNLAFFIKSFYDVLLDESVIVVNNV